VVIVGSVGTYLLFRQVLDEIDDNGHYEYTESVEYEYPADSYTTLDVSNVNGYVKIIGDVDATAIDIDGLKKAHSEEELDDMELQITKDAGTLVLVVIHELDDNTNESMDLDISIPADIIVKSAESINGKVEVSGVESVNRVHATNGAIMLEIIGIDKNVSVSTINGVIDVYILTSLNATVDMTTINGVISLNDVSLDLTVNEPNHVSGELNSGGYSIVIETVNGEIDLHALG